MPKKRGQGVRGKPSDWEELKKPRTINLTDTAWRLLQQKGGELEISRSEVIEQTVRGLINWSD